MRKFNYKLTFLFVYFLAIFVLLFVFYTLNNISSKSDVNNFANDSLKQTMIEKEQKINKYIIKHSVIINSLIINKIFQDYINNKNDIKTSEQLFLAVSNSLPEIFQLRYIDENGVEKIRVEKNLLSSNKQSFLIPKRLLQDKSKRYYTKKFLNLDKGKYALSEIDLNMENGKISQPKMATIRIASSIRDKNKNKKGFIIINILLDELFHTIENNKLFNIYLINKKGQFILHPNKDQGIYTKNFDKYFVTDQFDELHGQSILSYKKFIENDIYSKKLEIFHSEQNITLIIESKFNLLKEEAENEKLQLIYALVFLSVLLFPIVIYFASTPQRLNEKLIKQLITDDLTGLPNMEHLFKDIKDNKFNNSIIILLNITNYKNLQNVYGFEVSKELIKESSYFLQEYVNKNKDYYKIYKIKHDTFVLEYYFINKNSLDKSIKKLQETIENKEFNIFNKYEISLDLTIGISSIDKINNNIDKLKEAEIALDEALNLNLDKSIYNEIHIKNTKRSKDNLEKIKIIKEAIINDNVIIAFQPIYNNFQKKVEKYEVLVRLKNEDKIYYPDEFLQISKKIKKYKTLTKIIIDKTFKFFEDKDFEFSINLSMEDIIDEDVRTYLFEKIVKYNVQNKLVIELVETEAINNFQMFTEFIKEIKKLNCKVAIDDFGSGYSNYEYIIKLSDYIDYLKIDGSLITDINTNKKTQFLLGTLKFLCDNLKIKTIAEYVENKEIFEFLKSMNINYSQGYYIGKPEFELMVNDNIEDKKDDLDYF